MALDHLALQLQPPPAATAATSLYLFSPTQTHLSFTRRLRFSFKCAVEYSREHYSSSLQVPVAHPRPAEVPWKKDLCNAVSLIGVVGLPVEIKHLPSGKSLAWTRLAVEKSSTDTTWISLTFWDDLAHMAFQHLEKGNRIYVSGRLVSDAVETSDGKHQTYYKVVVQELNFVERSSPSMNGQDSDSFAPGRSSSSHSFTKHTESTQELWQAFFANPGEWWDNRKTKRNSKYPDFKHKDTGEALWIEGRNNPPWVKSQLAILDTRMGTSKDQDNKSNSNLFNDDSFFKCW